MNLEERMRELEIRHAKLESKLSSIANDIKEIKETLKDLAEVAKKQIEQEGFLSKLFAEREMLEKRVEELESDVKYLKKIAYGAVALAAVGMPILIELLKRLIN